MRSQTVERDETQCAQDEKAAADLDESLLIIGVILLTDKCNISVVPNIEKWKSVRPRLPNTFQYKVLLYLPWIVCPQFKCQTMLQPMGFPF